MMNWETGLKRGPFSDQQVKTLNELLPGMGSGQVQWFSGSFVSGSPVSAYPALMSYAEKELLAEHFGTTYTGETLSRTSLRSD